MAFRPTEVRDTPKSADLRPPATDGLTKREPRLATPEELAIAIPLKEEPKVGPGDRITTAVLFGLTGIGFMLGATPETARLLALGLWWQASSFIACILFGAMMLLAARAGWRKGMATAVSGWLSAGIVMMMGAGLLEDLHEGQPLSEAKGMIGMLVTYAGIWLLVWYRERDEGSDNEIAGAPAKPGSSGGPT